MSDKKELSSVQQLAIEHISQYARTRKHEAHKSIKEVLQMSNISWNTFEDAVAKLMSNARVALHFHPDRPIADMKCVAQSLLEQGIYKSQFETHIPMGVYRLIQVVYGIFGRKRCLEAFINWMV